MKFTVTTILAISAFIPNISAHLIMAQPKQWFVKNVDDPSGKVELGQGPQNPLLASGANYPCQGSAPEAPVATYAPGSMQELKLLGTAVHGGGSGQMSITYDTTPTKDSKFRVMTSWMGNHPISEPGNIMPGNAQFDLTTRGKIEFKVPAGLPAGKAVVAWTWFNKVGNREMYMKCATVMIGGSETSKAAFEALPEMFRANSGNGCTVPEGIVAIKFKNPGPHTVGTGITSIDCDKTQPGKPGGGSGGGASPTPTPTPTKPATPTKTNASPSTSPTKPPKKPDDKPNQPNQPKPSAPAPTASAAPGGTCTEGTITCNKDNTWSLCGSGRNQNMGQIAAGMKCSNGQFSKRGARLSHKHRRRHQLS